MVESILLYGLHRGRQGDSLQRICLMEGIATDGLYVWRQGDVSEVLTLVARSVGYGSEVLGKYHRLQVAALGEYVCAHGGQHFGEDGTRHLVTVGKGVIADAFHSVVQL